MKIINTIFSFLLFLIALNSKAQNPPQTIKELTDSIQRILDTTQTPSIGITLVQGDSILLATSIGISNIEYNIEADENTMYRIGSVSKMYVSLAILKLQEEGRINLKDEVRSLAPEIEYMNPWEKTNPILIEHLLEHTTGWDDMHLTEYAHGSANMTLKEGLDFHPHSRTSRWVPGTRMAYCNSGPPVAAYIIEKITGQKFEEYVKENFFTPMGMKNMTFYKSDYYKKFGATLYAHGIPQEYWHISMRPSGAINSTPKDMANMLLFFINRGEINDKRLISQESFDRMEIAKTTGGAKEGLEYGYALSNYDSPYEEFVYQGHSGAVIGGLTDFSYLPEHHLGYAFMINSGNQDAFKRISKLIRGFQLKGVPRNKIYYKTPEKSTDLSGYYISINPRVEFLYFLERILNIQEFYHKGDTLFRKVVLTGHVEHYLPINKHQFISSETGKIELVIAQDPIDGEVIYRYMQVLKPISSFYFYSIIVFICIWAVALLSSFLIGIYKLVLLSIGKIQKGLSFNIYVLPFTSTLTLVIAFIVIITIGSLDVFNAIGKVSLFSTSIFLLSIVFAVSSCWSLIYVIKLRTSKITKLSYWYVVIASATHFIVTCYLAFHQIIGIQLWG